MVQIAAIAACVILAGLGIFQLLLVLGLPLGHLAWGGKHTILPRKLRLASLISIFFYATFALIILEESGLTTTIANKAVNNFGIWILTAYFSLGIFMNAISRSKPERLAMTPVALALAVLCGIIALS